MSNLYQRSELLNMRPWPLDQGARDVRFTRRHGERDGDMVTYCLPCGWSRVWSCLEALCRAPEAIEDEVRAAIEEHLRPPPLTLAELGDLGWFGEEA